MESPAPASRGTSARRTANKIQQDERQQSGREGDATASLQPRGRGSAADTGGGRSPSAGDACEAPPSTSNNKIHRPRAAAPVALPSAASKQRSPRTYAAPSRSPRLAQGPKSHAIDRESIRLMMDDVLQKHTSIILRAIDKSTSTIVESSDVSELPEYSLNPSVDLAEERCFHVATNKTAIEKAESYKKEIEIPRQKKGELIGICKKMSRGASYPWMVKFEEWVEWWAQLKNPKGTRCIDHFVTSIPFQLFYVTIILANSVFVAIDANRQMEHYLDNTDTNESNVEQIVFLSLYVVELCLRALSEGRYFLIGDNMKWNWFDMAVIAVSILGEVVISKNSLSFLRVARLVNVVKATRMFRALQRLGLGELQRMVMQVFGCLKVLLWCFGLLAFITYIFAIFFMYSLVDHPRVEGEVADMERYFGSMSQTMLTLLQSTTGGIDWSDIYDVLYEAGVAVSFCFVLYVLFFVIAVWNIITATFVEKMATMAKPDNDAVAMAARVKHLEVAADLKALFQSMDLDSSHTMSYAETKACVSNPVFLDFLLANGVHIYEASSFLEMLFERGDVGSVNIETLVAYCLRIKGQATSLDLQTMRYELVHGLQRTQAMLETMEGQLAHLRRRGSARSQPAAAACDSGPPRNGSREPHN